jgi:hypothetical protein
MGEGALSRAASRVRAELKAAQQTYGIRSLHTNVIVLFPVACVFAFAAFMILPPTRHAVLWSLEENGPVELLTFAFLLAGGLWGVALAWRTKALGARNLTTAFYVIFSVGLILTAMEEIAWGQWFFGFETPASIKEINMQGELTLHNIRGLQGHNEFLRAAYGLGGIVGVGLSVCNRLPEIAAPVILLPFFAVIAGISGIDIYNGSWPLRADFDYAIQRLAELMEMLIGMSALLYVWLNGRAFTAGHAAQAAQKVG